MNIHSVKKATMYSLQYVALFGKSFHGMH